MKTFSKEVNNCVCVNPGKMVRGSSTGTYAQVVISSKPTIPETQTETQQMNAQKPNITVTLHKL